jgi:hypothetical protein
VLFVFASPLEGQHLQSATNSEENASVVQKEPKRNVTENPKMHDYESVKNFIQYRVQEVNEMEAWEADKQQRQGITLRLSVGHVALIDRLAKELALTRQDFLSSLIEVALQDSIKTLSDMAPEDQRMPVYKDYQNTMIHGGRDE